jgi:hypothetical protein
MPKGIYKGLICTGNKKEKFIPQQHQTDTMNFFLSSPYKGLLLYHELGSGKTCTSIMIADKMLRKKLVKKIYILTPGSLRQGWIDEYCSRCGLDPLYLKENFVFVTYNYSIGKNLPNFDNSLVVIDEVHNLINGVKNGSFHPTAIYDSLSLADCRILALSGSVVYNFVYEFALLGSLLKPGGEFKDIRLPGKKELNPQAFMKWFNIDDDGLLTPVNKTTIKRRLEGIISYFPGAGKEFVPEVLEQEPILCQMTEFQENNYWNKREQELKLAKPPSPALRVRNKALYDSLSKLYIMAQKKILTRLASNFYYGAANIDQESDSDDFEEPTKPAKKINIERSDDKTQDLDEDMADLAVSPSSHIKRDVSEKEGGWISKGVFENGNLYKLYSPKFTALLLNIALHINQKHLVFTFFKERGGVYLIKSLLALCGITSAIFSGDLDDKERSKLLKKFNSPENRYGDLIRVLLVTEAGAEGISVLETRHMHILESSNRVGKTFQAIGRVARFKSHINLPLSERNVKIWRYWSIASNDPVTITTKTLDRDGKQVENIKTIEDKRCIDQLLYEAGNRTKLQVDSFKDLLKTASVTTW